MADAMKVRAKMNGDVCDINVLVTHNMETGQRKDADGKTIPAHFIQTISVAVNGKTIIAGQTGGSVSKNPVFNFKTKGAKAGDKVTVTWKDNKGDTRTDEAAVA